MSLRRLPRPLAALLCLALFSTDADAERKPKPGGKPARGITAVTGEAPVMAAGRIEQTSPGEYLLSGDVDFRYGNARVLADTVRYSESSHRAVAEGNVVVQFGESQVSGDRVEADLESGYAIIENARAYFEPDVIMDAHQLERIGEDTFKITRGKITTCTQPTPYWSFNVGSAIVHVGGYARMTNAAFRLGKVPAFWSPYLVWPIKEDRAAGLLLPQFGFSGKRGAFLSNALYVPMGRSMDATAQFDFFNGAISNGTEQLPQSGQGLEFRYVPSRSGSGILTGYQLTERFRPGAGLPVEERDRYMLSLSHSQRFASGYRLLADVNTVSDLDYYQDFSREIQASTSPTVLSQIDLNRLAGPFSFSTRFNRQLQFLEVDPATLEQEDLTLWRLPELELRGRGIRVGRSRFYLAFESSFDGLARRSRTVDDLTGAFELEQTTYTRYDLAPTISGNFTPVPWLDISPSLSVRETWYSARDADSSSKVDPVDDPFRRDEFRFGVSVVGPRLYKLLGEDAPDSTRYKHTFEPGISYEYAPEVTGGEKILVFDEIDTARPLRNLLRYSLTSRLFAKRPPKAQEAGQAGPVLSGTFASLVTGEEPPTRRQELVPSEPPGESAPSASGEPAAAAPPEAGAEGPDDAAKDRKPSLDAAGSSTYVPPDISTRGVSGLPQGEGRDGRQKAGVGSVEIATFEVAQSYTFDDLQPLSSSNRLQTDSQLSPIEGTVRVNPGLGASLDIRSSYDILFNQIRSISVSGNLRAREHSYLRFSWFLNRDLEGSAAAATGPPCAEDFDLDAGRCFLDSSQIRMLGGVALWRRKLTADVEGSYDIQNSDLQDQRYRLGYNTQCCGVLVEISRRDLLTTSLGETTETEYRFVLNLRGVGTFLDLNGRAQ